MCIPCWDVARKHKRIYKIGSVILETIFALKRKWFKVVQLASLSVLTLPIFTSPLSGFGSKFNKVNDRKAVNRRARALSMLSNFRQGRAA
jgi:hypothetical protein